MYAARIPTEFACRSSFIGMTEEKMETTIRGYIGFIMGLYWGYDGTHILWDILGYWKRKWKTASVATFKIYGCEQS